MKILMSKDIHTIPLGEKAKAYNANNPKEKEQAFRTLKLDQ